MKKFLIVCAVAFGLLAIAAGVFVAFFDFDKLLNEQKDKYLPEIEKLIGRKVEVGKVATTFLPVLGAELQNIRVHAASEGEKALVELPAITFQVELWAAIKSFGKDLRLKALVIDGMKVNVVRRKDGTLSYEDIVKRLTEGPPSEEEAPKPLDPEVVELIKTIKLKRVALQNATFNLIDQATGGDEADLQIHDFLFELKDVALSDPFNVHLSAAIFSKQKNFDLKVVLGPIPFDDPASCPVDFVELHANEVNLAAVMPYLGNDLPVKIASAQFGADLRIDDPLATRGKIIVKGGVDLAHVAVGMPNPGPEFTVSVHPNLTFAPESGDLDLTGFVIKLNDIALLAEGQAHQLTSERPSFDNLQLHTEHFDLEKLLGLVPDVKNLLPKGTNLKGELVLKALASGDPSAQDFKLDLNLDNCLIALPQTFYKAQKTPLHLLLDAHLTQSDADLRDFDLSVGPLKLALKGTVQNFEDPQFNIEGGTGTFNITQLVRMLPSVHSSIPADVTVGGSMNLDVKAKGNLKNLDAGVRLGLVGADLEVPGTTLKGNGNISVTAKGNPEGAIGVRMNANMTPLEILAAEAFQKPTGTPLTLDANVQVAGSKINLGGLKFVMGPVNLSGSGSMNTASQTVALDATLARMNLAELSKMVPALAESPVAKANLGMGMSVKGSLADMTQLEASLRDFFFGLGRSSVTGQATVKNIEVPNIQFAFNAPILDIDEMFPSTGAAKEESGESGPVIIPEIVKQMTVNGQLGVGQGKVAGFPFQNFKAGIGLQNGVLTFSALDFNAYEGKFTAAKTTANLAGAEPTFDADFDVSNVNVKKLLAEQANLKDVISGRMGAHVDLKGRSFDWPVLSQNLNGKLNVHLKDGQLEKLDLQKQVLGSITNKLPMAKLNLPKTKAVAFKDLLAEFMIKDGKAQLKKPMELKTGEGPLSFDGYIGLDTSLSLDGDWKMSPEVVHAITFKKVKPSKPVNVGISLGGTVDDPKFKSLDVTELAEVIAKGLIGSSLGIDLEDAKAQAAKLKKQAEAAAQAKIDEAKAKADEAKKKAEAEAKKKADEAKKKAKDKAKDKIKKLF